MKKIAAILLMTLFLFNLVGYRLLFNYEQQRADKTFEASLDRNDFNESDLITIKVPLSLPYQNNQQNFERVDGELKLHGKIYKYVKRKISEGQLILLCLPDDEKMQLQSAKDDYFKDANDLVQNHHSKKPVNTKTGVFKNLVCDYDHSTSVTNSSILSARLVHARARQASCLPSAPHSSPDRPPRQV